MCKTFSQLLIALRSTQIQGSDKNLENLSFPEIFTVFIIIILNILIENWLKFMKIRKLIFLSFPDWAREEEKIFPLGFPDFPLFFPSHGFPGSGLNLSLIHI